jgi:hypothetical protein
MTTRKIQERGNVFIDKNMLIQHIIDLRSREGKLVNEEDMIFFLPEEGRRYISLDQDTSEQKEDQNNDGNCDAWRDSTQIPPNSMMRDENSEEEDIEMNLVKHLCSTTMDPRTGLPTQKLTVMSGDSGACSF